MKTIKLLCLMMIISSLSYSQIPKGVNANKIIDNTSKAVERAYNDGTKVINKTYEAGKVIAPKVEKAIESLSTTLKVGADKVWDILVKQQLVYSWGILALILVTIFSWCNFYYRWNTWYKGGKDDGHIGICILTAIIAIAGTITSTIHFFDMLTGFINPEFGAMKTIAEIASLIK